MLTKRFSRWYILMVWLIAAAVSSCQKDQGVTQEVKKKSLAAADSALNVSNAGNYLALHGTLTLKIQDSTYTFNAANDSVAFVNLSEDDENYFGITAVNKAHTMSFAVSSKGMAASGIISGVEGSQLLFSPDVMHTRQYTLTQFAEPGDAGKFTLDTYKRDSVLAKGTFFTFLAKDAKADSPFYRVEGSFDLQIK